MENVRLVFVMIWPTWYNMADVEQYGWRGIKRLTWYNTINMVQMAGVVQMADVVAYNMANVVQMADVVQYG